MDRRQAMDSTHVISQYRAPRDIAFKLFREAGRAWNADDAQAAADHLFNFCVTNSALRDWLQVAEGKEQDGTYRQRWRAGAGGLFGECADIANAAKHLLLAQASAQETLQEVIALGPNGHISGSERMKETFLIVLRDGSTIDLLGFIYRICTAWEEIFRQNGDPLPEHGNFLVVRA
jgi:hypothetical protein